MLGHETIGSGPRKVVILNDWLCDTSTWDGARSYLDGDGLTWAFADLRGYGRSREQAGEHTVEEAAADVIELCDALGWKKVAIVGHSMSTLVALHLAQHFPDRIERAVVLTPAPPAGFGADDARLGAMRALALGSDAERAQWFRLRHEGRLSEGWVRFKLARWRETADPEGAAAYVAMFARRGLPDRERRIECPLLAVTGERDVEIMRSEAVTRLLAPLCARLVVAPLADSGHYPMQEAPPLLVATVERFLAGDADG
jgi:3-oxoadipate enol-lactonase